MGQCKLAALILVLALLAVTAVSGCTSGGTPASPSVDPLKAGLPDTLDYQISVTGGTNGPITLTYADLKSMDFKTLSDASTVNSAGTVTTGNYTGVPMAAILDRAGMPQGNLTFKVTATDGYTKIYTMDQMKASILGLKVNDTAMTTNINDKVKSIRMIVPGETNDMWIKMPVKIEIIPA